MNRPHYDPDRPNWWQMLAVPFVLAYVLILFYLSLFGAMWKHAGDCRCATCKGVPGYDH